MNELGYDISVLEHISCEISIKSARLGPFLIALVLAVYPVGFGIPTPSNYRYSIIIM